jgi:hypothetical protein
LMGDLGTVPPSVRRRAIGGKEKMLQGRKTLGASRGKNSPPHVDSPKERERNEDLKGQAGRRPETGESQALSPQNPEIHRTSYRKVGGS